MVKFEMSLLAAFFCICTFAMVHAKMFITQQKSMLCQYLKQHCNQYACFLKMTIYIFCTARHIILIFTKWTEVFSLKTRTVLGVALQLFAGKFCCFGCANVMLPSFGCVETVISDQGREFVTVYLISC